MILLSSQTLAPNLINNFCRPNKLLFVQSLTVPGRVGFACKLPHIKTEVFAASHGKSTSRARTSRKKIKDSADVIRLNKFLAEAGVGSRRACEELILQGLVTVEGNVVQVPHFRVSSKETVEVEGKPVKRSSGRKWYFAVNKPKGYTCTAEPSEGRAPRQHAIRLLDDWVDSWKRLNRGQPPPRLRVAGNLDVNATGLLLVTNDGSWAAKVTSQSVGITKEYSLVTKLRPTKAQLKGIADGAAVDEEGREFVKPVAVAQDLTSPSPRLRIVVGKGSSRQVRSLVESTGLRVNSVKRVRIGGYRMPRELGFGNILELKPHEVRRITDRGADASV